MKFKNFSIFAVPHITDAYCKCGDTLKEVSDGFFSTALFCPKCESVYTLRLVKVKVSKEYLEQCREEVKK